MSEKPVVYELTSGEFQRLLELDPSGPTPLVARENENGGSTWGRMYVDEDGFVRWKALA